MIKFTKDSIIGVIGSGAMGSGIAQVASQNGHVVFLYDNKAEALTKSAANLKSTLSKLVEKQKISQGDSDSILKNVHFVSDLNDLKVCDLVIEAIVENLEIKQKVFAELDQITKPDCVLATNTSSLSVTSIASSVKDAGRVIGIHFFNPAPLMPLVEIIPGIATNTEITEQCVSIISGWKKVTVVCKDTPGFIVNRVARPYYGEAMRIYEEGIADIPTIDWAMKEIGGFKMGPFELTDLIGHDVNYVVTETVWKQFYFDPKFKPSLCQKRLVEAKYFGRKSGKGFYNYVEGVTVPEPKKDMKLGNQIFVRIISMLINEAYDALYMNVASAKDIDLAMTKGVNYPKGLIEWGNEIGLKNVLNELDRLRNEYNEDRYRANVLLKRSV